MNTRTLTGLVLVVSTLVACTDDKKDGAGGPNGDGPSVTNSTGAKFFLPTGEPDNTSAPTVIVDSSDTIHTVYPAYAIGGLYYGHCGASCKGPDDVKVIPFATEGTVHNAMISLDAEDRPHLLYQTMQHVYYATCTGDCSDASGWSSNIIMDLDGNHEVSGKAFAFDRNGHPRFLVHTSKAYLGIGQKAPETFWASCDASCENPASWKQSKIADQMWRGTTLRFDADGRAHVAMVADIGRTESSSGKEMGTYALCESDCEKEASWTGTALWLAFESDLEAVSVGPSISLALTKAGKPRIAMLGAFEETLKRNITYFECDENCTGEGWRGSVLSDLEEINVGIDLALDANDKPRFVHTLDYNIALVYCDDADCTAENANWGLTKVEYGGEMKPDEIFLYDNCNVSAWFLHSPSLALTKDGRPRVGYQARDISGGWSNPNPNAPDCVAGTDMTWSRLAVLSSTK